MVAEHRCFHVTGDGVLTQDHDSLYLLAEFLVGHADDGHVVDIGVCQETVLDLP